MITSDAIHNEIHELHVAIERLFTGTTGRDAIDALLARFSEDFLLVAPTGARLDKPAVRRLFETMHATRPGFGITIGDVTTRALPPAHALALYREDQIDAAGTRTSRLSTALLEDRRGGLIWRHLHETWVPVT